MAARGHQQMVAVPAGGVGTHSSGGANLGRLISAGLTLALVFVGVYVAFRYGLGALLNFADPTGIGQPIVGYPDGGRLLHVVRNLAGVAALVGGALYLTRWSKEHGAHMVFYGLVVLACCILGPHILRWFDTNAGGWVDTLLNHPGSVFPSSGQ